MFQNGGQGQPKEAPKITKNPSRKPGRQKGAGAQPTANGDRPREAHLRLPGYIYIYIFIHI